MHLISFNKTLGNPTKRHRRKRRRCFAILLLLLIAAAIYGLWPRTMDVRSFDPQAAARLEAHAWRHYYEKHYLQLAADLYILCRGQTGASPARSIQIIWHAVRAAKLFQQSQSREEALRALPHLRSYYAAIATGSDAPFDTEQAARLEIEWWQQRREHAAPEIYAQTIADGSAVFYGTRNPDTEQAALLRAQAMAHRDARRNGQMTPADWLHIEHMLHEAYQHLQRGILRN